MRILQTSDTHLGLTKFKAIRKMLLKASKEDFDVIVHCGDYCGGTKGHKTTRATVELIREIFPDKPFVSVLGNHDYWYRKDGRPSAEEYYTNLEKIRQCFQENDVHFLDEDGIYVHPDFPGVVIMGHSGWYKNPDPPTNDYRYLPWGLDGNTNWTMYKNSTAAITEQMDELKHMGFEPSIHTLVYVSHFPVIEAKDYKGGFDLYGGDSLIGKLIAKEYGCRHFLNGHAHQFHCGPLRYEAGSDYYNPKHQIIEV